MDNECICIIFANLIEVELLSIHMKKPYV